MIRVEARGLHCWPGRSRSVELRAARDPGGAGEGGSSPDNAGIWHVLPDSADAASEIWRSARGTSVVTSLNAPPARTWRIWTGRGACYRDRWELLGGLLKPAGRSRVTSTMFSWHCLKTQLGSYFIERITVNTGTTRHGSRLCGQSVHRGGIDASPVEGPPRAPE